MLVFKLKVVCMISEKMGDRPTVIRKGHLKHRDSHFYFFRDLLFLLHHKCYNGRLRKLIIISICLESYIILLQGEL